MNCKKCNRKLNNDNTYKNTNRKSDPEYYLKWLKSNNGKYSRLKSRARDRKIEFKITKEEYCNNFIDKNCYYCGENSNGEIDRIDSTGIYILNNCIPCCWRCNVMKNSQNQEDFLKACRKIAKNSYYNKLLKTHLEDCSDLDTNEL